MRRRVAALLLASGLATNGTTWAREGPTAFPVAPRGGTHITAGGITLDLTTRPATPVEDVSGHATRCTGGRTRCSLVDELSIRLRGRHVLIPERLPLLLSDVSTASVIRIAPNRYRLTLKGGDAAAAYEARIYFDQHMVRRAEFWSGEMHALEQATEYHDIAGEMPSN